jgi:hypothetical protein
MQKLTGNRFSEAGTIFAAVTELDHASHCLAAALRIESRIWGFLAQRIDGAHDQFINRMKMAAPDFFLHQTFRLGFKLYRHNSNLKASGAWRKLGLSIHCRGPGRKRNALLPIRPFRSVGALIAKSVGVANADR